MTLHLWEPWSRRRTTHWPSPPALRAGHSQEALQVTCSWIWNGEVSLWHFLSYYCPGSALIWKALQSEGSPERRARWRSAVPEKKVKTQMGTQFRAVNLTCSFSAIDYNINQWILHLIISLSKPAQNEYCSQSHKMSRSDSAPRCKVNSKNVDLHSLPSLTDKLSK